MLFHFIDWIMRLPGYLEDRLWDTIHKIEEEIKMPYITSVERIGYKRGLSDGVAQGVAQGVKQAIELGLSLKFGDDAAGSLMPHIHNMQDPDWLMMIKDAIRSTDSIDEIRELILAKPGQA